MLGHGVHGKPGAWKAIGAEGAGEVVAVGAEVTGFRPGDRVMGRCAGAFSEYALMESAEAMPVPAGLSLEQAAGIPLTFLVSYDMLVLQGRLSGRMASSQRGVFRCGAWPRSSSARRGVRESSVPRAQPTS